MNKAHLFDNDVKAKGWLSAAKIIPILVNFGHKMETTLVEIRKLVLGSQAGSSRPPLPSLAATPQKEKSLVGLKTPLQQLPIKDLIAEVAKIEISAIPTLAKTKGELETPKTTSSEHSPYRSGRKKMEEPSPESEEEEESLEEEIESSGGEPESEDEAKPAITLPKYKKKIETRSSDQKKPTFAFKTLASQKRPTKTPRKGESFQKKPKRK